MRELAAALPRTLAQLPSRIAPRRVALSLSPQTRRRLVLAAVVAAVLGSLYMFWFRDSSFVAVETVDVSGLTSKEGPRIASALAAAGEDMTTLHIRTDELEQVAAQFPVVASISVERDFPHGLRIAVTERHPAALVSVGDVPLPVSADGTVLRGVQPGAGLPLLRMEDPPVDGRVADPRTLRALHVAGAAPQPFPERIERISEGPERGIVVALEEGPEIVFGDADLVEQKWAAATRVLADPEARGATYIDVRLPERPVAGGLPVETIEPVAPAGEPIAAPEAAAPVDPATIDPATGQPIDPATGAPVAPTAEPTDPAAAAPTDPVTPAPEPTAPAAGTTGAVTAPQP